MIELAYILAGLSLGLLGGYALSAYFPRIKSGTHEPTVLTPSHPPIIASPSVARFLERRSVEPLKELKVISPTKLKASRIEAETI